MTTHAVYVLASNWGWDNDNIEYATTTIEEPDCGFEALLDPKVRPLQKETLVRQLEKIAKSQSGNPMGVCSLVALYRIVQPDGRKWVNRTNWTNGLVDLNIRMKPVCGFGKDNTPVPIKQAAHAVGGTTKICDNEYVKFFLKDESKADKIGVPLLKSMEIMFGANYRLEYMMPLEDIKKLPSKTAIMKVVGENPDKISEITLKEFLKTIEQYQDVIDAVEDEIAYLESH